MRRGVWFGTALAVAVLGGPAFGEGACGTAVDFLDSPKEAAALAKKEEKLVFILHVSGLFEDPRFT